jgi:hypothetical protein
VIEDQKIVVGQTTTTKRARKPRAKKPASKSSFIHHRNDDYSMTCESLERGRGEVKNCFPFFLFQISFIFFIFFILSNAKVSKNKYAVEKEKTKWWIWG